MSYTRRIIKVDFAGAVNLSVSGLRTFVRITQANTPTPSTMLLQISGLTLSTINSLSRCGNTFLLPQNDSTVTVSAGDETGLTTVFKGTPIYAYPDFSNQPAVSFVMECNGTYPLQLGKADPVSLQGGVPVEDGLKQILTPIGAIVQNNGVSAMLSNPYFSGSMWDQCKKAVRAADCGGYYDSTSNKFTIWPKQGGTSPDAPILIAPETGAIGYPSFQQSQIVVRTVFSGNIFTTPSQVIQVKSQLAAATGMFVAWGVEYDLSSETPGGPWEVTITASPQ